MSQTQTLQITICKLVSTRLMENQKIHMLLQKQKEKRYSTPCTVKNGTANFYRQKFQFTSEISEFRFKIFECQNNKLLYCMTVGQNVVQQIYYHPNTFETKQEQFHFFWQAQLLREPLQKDTQSEQKIQYILDITISDEFIPYHQQQTGKPNNRRGSILVKNQDTQSEPGEIFETSQNQSTVYNILMKKYSCTYNQAKKQNLHLTERQQKIDKFLLQQIQSEQSISENKIQAQSTKYNSPQRQPPTKLQHTTPKTRQSDGKNKKQIGSPTHLPYAISNPCCSPRTKIRPSSMVKKPKNRFFQKFDINYVLFVALLSSIVGVAAANL